MAKYKTNNASALEHLGDMPDIPNSLDGLLQGTMVESTEPVLPPSVNNEAEGNDVKASSEAGKKSTSTKKSKTVKSPKTPKAKADEPQEVVIPTKLEGKDLWEQFVNMCESDKELRKDLGRGGTAKLMRIENDIVDTFSMCRVNDHTITTMVNAILRCFVLHYKNNFLQYKTEKHTTII